MAKEIEILNSSLLERTKEHLRLVVKGHRTLDESLVQDVDEFIANYMLLARSVASTEPVCIAGDDFGVADCYLFPIIEQLAEYKSKKGEEVSVSMKEYLDAVRPTIELISRKEKE